MRTACPACAYGCLRSRLVVLDPAGRFGGRRGFPHAPIVDRFRPEALALGDDAQSPLGTPEGGEAVTRSLRQFLDILRFEATPSQSFLEEFLRVGHAAALVLAERV